MAPQRTLDDREDRVAELGFVCRKLTRVRRFRCVLRGDVEPPFVPIGEHVARGPFARCCSVSISVKAETSPVTHAYRRELFGQPEQAH